MFYGEVKLYWDQQGKEHAVHTPEQEAAALKAGWIDTPGTAPEITNVEAIAAAPSDVEVIH